MKNRSELKEEVKECLVNAEDNGYPVWDHDPRSILGEIIEQTGEFENDDYDLMIEIIAEVQNDFWIDLEIAKNH